MVSENPTPAAVFEGVVVAQRTRSATSDAEFHIDISGAGPSSISESWSSFFAPGTPVTALPSWSQPRLLVPRGTLLEGWRASRMYPAFRHRAKAFRHVVRAAAALSILPSRPAEEGKWSLQPVLEKYLPEARTLSLLIGTPGVGQKLTAECRDGRGRAVGYLKYADRPVAMAQLRNEADVLEAVPNGVGPKLLGCIRWQKGLLLLTRPIEGRPVRAQFPPPDALSDFACALQLPDKTSLYEHPWVRRMRASEHVPHAVRALAGREWNLTIQHGDLAAWNVRGTETGLRAFDWEYGSIDGFPYLDIAHFVLQHAALIAKWPSARGASVAADYLRSATTENLSAAEAAALIQLAAFNAYRNDPAPDEDPLQQWRQRIWRAIQ